MPELTLSDQVFDWLEEAIIRGTYAPGSRLDELALSRAFGVSRGPVREAIRRLEGKRLVERVARSGVRVACRSPEDLIELLAIREALEGMACRLAATRISDDAIERLEDLLAVHEREIGAQAGANYFQKPGDYDFHFRIVQESGNQHLSEMIFGELYYRLRAFRYRSSERAGRAEEALAEHRRILKAIRRRDAEGAEREMRAHLARAREAAEEEVRLHQPPKLKRA